MADTIKIHKFTIMRDLPSNQHLYTSTISMTYTDPHLDFSMSSKTTSHASAWFSTVLHKQSYQIEKMKHKATVDGAATVIEFIQHKEERKKKLQALVCVYFWVKHTT